MTAITWSVIQPQPQTQMPSIVVAITRIANTVRIYVTQVQGERRVRVTAAVTRGERIRVQLAGVRATRRGHSMHRHLPAAIILFTIVAALIGGFFPGRVTGLLLPIALTMWWLLYRVMRRGEI